MKFFENYGYVLKNLDEVEEGVVNHIAYQLHLDVDELCNYNLESRMSRKHNEEIRLYCRFSVINNHEIQKVKEHLVKHKLPFNATDEELQSEFCKYLYDSKIERFSLKEIDKYIASWKYEYEVKFFDSAERLLTQKSKQALDQIISKKEDIEFCLHYFCLEPKGLSLKEMLAEGAKLKFIKDNGLLNIYDNLPKELVVKYYNYVSSTPPSELSKYKAQKKYVMLACFCYIRGKQSVDYLIDMFIRLTYKISQKAKKKVSQEFWVNRKIMYNTGKLLRDIAKVSIDKPEGVIQETIYPVVSKSKLEKIAQLGQTFDEYSRQSRYSYMRSTYVHYYKKMLSFILEIFEFRSNNKTSNSILEGVSLVKKYINEKHIFYPKTENVPKEGIVTKSLHSIIMQDDKVNKVLYELTVMMALRSRLICREIWVSESDKYADPDKNLPQDYEANKVEYCQDLGLPYNGDEFISIIQSKLKSELKKLNKNIPENKYVHITKRCGKAWIKVSPITLKSEPQNIKALKQEILSKWPISLLDILKETEFRLNLTKSFTSAASREAIDPEELRRRILLCIFSLGTNTGFKRIEPDIQEVEKLRYVHRRYIAINSMRSAIIKVINGNLKIRDKELFGDAKISCASDSTKFGAWDQNLMTEWHIRYGCRGVMIYWHVDKESLCVYSQLKTCSSSEVASMIEGVLYHNTDAELEKNYVDTHGQSLVGFAFCYLLKFELLPQIKLVEAEKLFTDSSDSHSEYKNIQKVLKREINWEIIKQNYDLILQYAIALKCKFAKPEVLIKRFSGNNANNSLYIALQELGRAVKTIFLCRYLYSKELREEINEALNVVERWNSINDFIFYGKKSTISKNEISEQELSILSLHLLQSSLVYINTLMIQRVLESPEWRNKLTIEDRRALSPLIYLHVNPYGTFRLDMNKRLVI